MLQNKSHFQSPPSEEIFKYDEVVRKMEERRSLPGHACQECDAFAKFMVQQRERNGNQNYKLKEDVQRLFAT